MLPRSYIIHWRQFAPWQFDAQVEQDLVISKALVCLYKSELIREKLAFRGGTALNKLYFNPPARYSEDIDLVQIAAEPIGAIIDEIRLQLDNWLGSPKRKQNEGRVTLTYKFESEIPPIIPLKLKIEINTREHISVLGFIHEKYAIDSPLISDKVKITTYQLEELVGTKIRALYQRKKGRDLFDLYMIIQKFPNINGEQVCNCFTTYIELENNKIKLEDLLNNLDRKIADKTFCNDIKPLLISTVGNYDVNQAYKTVKSFLLKYLQTKG